MDSKHAEKPPSQETGGIKPCIVRITRSSRPRWLSKMIHLAPDAQVNAYANKLSKVFSSPKSALIITSPIALPKEIFGKNKELSPIKCTITHINFVSNNLKLSLHYSTKSKLLAAYDHFLTTWPMRHVLRTMKEMLRSKFVQYVDKLKWKVGCEILKCVDRQGRGNLQDLYVRILTDSQAENVNGRRKKRQGKASPQSTVFPIGLGELLEGAVEAVKSLFAPGLPASVPVNIWGIPWIISKENIKKFKYKDEDDGGNDHHTPRYNSTKTGGYEKGPTKQKLDERASGESDQGSSEDIDGEFGGDEDEEDEILESIVLAPYTPPACPPILSKFQMTVRHFESNFLRLYNNQRKRCEDLHPLSVPSSAKQVKPRNLVGVSSSSAQHGTKRGRGNSESSYLSSSPSSSSSSFSSTHPQPAVKRLKFGNTGSISRPCLESLGQTSNLGVSASTSGFQHQNGVRNKRSHSESSFSDISIPTKRLKRRRSANISETSNGGKVRRPSISSTVNEEISEAKRQETTSQGHKILGDNEGSENQQQKVNQPCQKVVHTNEYEEYDTEIDDDPQLPTTPPPAEIETFEYEYDETDTNESEESDAEPVQVSHCQGGKFKSGYQESQAARDWYYV